MAEIQMVYVVQGWARLRIRIKSISIIDFTQSHSRFVYSLYIPDH